MHKPRKFVFSFLLFSAGLSTAASNFDDGVPLELVEAFTSGQIYSGLPVDFPDVNLPDAVSVMGSLDNNYNQTVVFSVSGSIEEAGQSLAGSFMNEGWIQLLSYEFQQPENGFIYPNAESFPIGQNQQYCNDRYGMLTITPAPQANNTINLSLSNQAMMQPGFSCEEQNNQRRLQRDRMGGMPFGMINSQNMPRLVLPEDANQNRMLRVPFSGGGFSGSSNDFETNAGYSGELEIDALYDHFAVQLEEQGWQLDSEWSGEKTAGGNWTANLQNRSYLGILSILERNEGIFELKFRLLTMGGSSSEASIGGFNIIRDVRAP